MIEVYERRAAEIWTHRPQGVGYTSLAKMFGDGKYDHRPLEGILKEFTGGKAEAVKSVR
jgi:hypothetical protein